jgi:hypothetical protein
VRLTRHARNNLRLYEVTAQDVESAARNPIGKDSDERGNPRYRGLIGGRPYLVVVALDEPDAIITHLPEDRG